MPDNMNLRSGWKIVRFDQIAQNITARAEPTPEDSAFYVGLEHMESGSLRIRRWGSQTDLIGTKLKMQKGDILFARRNAYLKRVALAPHDGLFSAHGMVLRPRQEVVLAQFLPFYMQSDLFMDRAIAISVGSLSPTINWKTLASQEFAIPPIELQEKFTNRMLAISGAIDSTEDAISASMRLTQSLRDSLLDEVTVEFGNSPLGEHADGLMGFAFKSDNFVEKGVQLLRMGGLNGRRLDLTRDPVFLPKDFEREHSKFLLKPGDIVLSMTGTTGKQDYGFAVQLPDDAPSLLLNQRVIKITPTERLDKDYLLNILWSSAFLLQVYSSSPGSKQANLSKQDLMKIGIPVPHLEVQRKIVSKISSCINAMQSIAFRCQKLKHIFQLEQHAVLNIHEGKHV